MPSNGDSNFARLKQADVIIREELPEPFLHLVNGLTPDEVDMLVAMKNRLDAAAKWHGLEPATSGEVPPFTTFMVF